MAITKKPSYTKDNDYLTETIINRGGNSYKDKNNELNDIIKITLRLPIRMLNIIDTHLEKSINKKTRTHWIREAVEEKIEREIVKDIL